MKTTAYEALLRPLPRGSWNALYWGSLARLMRLGEPLSEGLRIGYRYGFDSGEMLDYVYQNEAHGRWGIGTILDRVYLNAVGWRAIRQRKTHLKTMLCEAIGERRAAGRRLHLVDVAAGPGRYLLEVLQEAGSDDLQATLRDWDEAGLAQGRVLANTLGIPSVRYERGDAFSSQDLARISPRPHVVIVSGLYELFADNALIRRSLGGIYDVLEEGGWLIYTNQPAHPQLELIARCLINREGQPWVMRLRPQEEMDGLVAAAGFRPHKTSIGPWNICTVTAARKLTRP